MKIADRPSPSAPRAHDHMKLLLLTEYFAPHAGGTAVYYYEICRRLRGLDVTVVTRMSRGAVAFDRGLPFTVIRTPFLPVRKIRVIVEWWAQFLVGLWLVLSRRADVVHAGQVYPVGLAAYGIHVITGVPYAVYIFGEDITIASRHRLRRAAVALVLRHAAAVFVISRFSRAQVIGLGVERGRIHLARPGVDAQRFRPADAASFRNRFDGDGRYVLLTTGRLIPRKGQDTVIEVLPRIAAAVPNVTYWIAGGGSVRQRQKLERLAAAAGVADRVRFLGEVPADDLPTLYAACDVFVMLNRTTPDGDTEGYGMVFVEAGACGRSVVGGRAGGAGEAIRHGRTGFLVPEGDDATAVATLIRLLRDPQLRTRLGEAGRRRAVSRLSWDGTARRVERVTKALERSRVRPAVAVKERVT